MARPALQAWEDDAHPLHLVEQTVARDAPDPKAPACYGLVARSWDAQGQRSEEVWLRFGAGRPVSTVTVDVLTWCSTQAQAQGKRAVLLIGDNASWHDSPFVRTWVRQYNRQVKQAGHSVLLLMCFLPNKSPWLNPIEPKWLHGKRTAVEPARLLTTAELADHICTVYGCVHEPHLVTPKNAA